MGTNFSGIRTPGISKTLALFLPLLLLTAVAPCRAQNPATSSDQKADKTDKVDKEFSTPKDRLAAIQAATIFAPKTVADANIMQGPDQDPKQFQFHPNDKVFCDFVKLGSQMGGKTPKFDCKITKVQSADGSQVQTLTPQMDEEPVKVKYGATDNEVYAEIVATSLMWALGFYADSWFPVHVECDNRKEIFRAQDV